MLRRVIFTLLTLLLAAPVVALTTPADAATPAPTGLTAPAQTSEIPTLSWDRVPEATSYEVQVSPSSTFSPITWSTITVNVRAVPAKQLPSGDLWFRVRAIGPQGSSEWSVRSLTKQQGEGPTLRSPGDGEHLQQPEDPVLLSWTPVAGATKYSVQVSSDAGFTDPTLVKTYETQTTTLVRPDSQPARPYYWRVAGVLAPGITSKWSESRSYVLDSLPAAQLTSPANGSAVTVDDVVLDWQPVPGATSYDVEISLVPDFSTTIHTQTAVVGTRYSPPTTLDNNQYYWRVRARDVFNNVQDADQVSRWTFRRAWPDQPQLQYPADGAAVGDPFYFQWSPVKLASRYMLEITDTEGTSRRCYTAQTTWTPRSADQAFQDCWPQAGGTYSWTVIALDDPKIVQTDPVGAPSATFTYTPGLVQPLLPADGEQVTVPTLRWSPHKGAASYRVTIVNQGTGASSTTETLATSFTPRTRLATGSYRWSVQWVSQDGRISRAVAPGAQQTFSVASQPTATAGTPEPTLAPATYDRFPTLTWTPVAGATQYKLLVRRAGTITNTVLDPSFGYPAGEDETDRFLQPGDYVWSVEAYANQVYLSTSTTEGRFTIAERGAVTGLRLALSGTDTADPATSCALTPESCEGVRNTPVLRWDAEPGAAFYELNVSYDRELTNPIGKSDGYPVKFPIVVNNTMWTPSIALPDGDAGTAYYWAVRACTAAGACRRLEYANNSFSKLSSPVKPTSPGVALSQATPANLPSLPDDITFTWEDYLQTSRTGSTDQSTLKTPARSEARQYRIQVSDDPQFNTPNLLDNQVVDQTTFTSFANTYPDTQLYWRVQAIDGSNNPLPWSPKWTFDKQSPVPQPLDPVGESGADGAPYDGSTPIRWAPLGYAAAYEAEVYRNNDTKPDTANRVDGGVIAQTAVSWLRPVQPADTLYTWRVRRVDAKGRKGDWSAWSSYKVTADAVRLDGPADGTTVPPAEGLFSWDGVARAASYRWERRAPGSATTAATTTTVATSYAPTTTLPDGPWEWRVVAVDSNGKDMSHSDWSGFRVVGAPSAQSAPQVEGSGQTGTMLTSLDPAWDLTGVTNYYQWLRAGSPIPGATTSTYEVTGADVGKAISLRVTGRKPGYRDATTTSNAITGVSGPAPTVHTQPRIEGSGRVGDVITATPPVWNEEGVTNTYQWLRNGQVISGQTNSNYTVTGTDVDKDLVFRVTGKKVGYGTATADSNSIRGLAGPAAVNDGRPVVTGSPKVGEVLSSTSGTWTPSSGLSFGYQWLRAGAPIPGATSASYRLQAADAGRSVSVKVLAKRTGYADGTATSDSLSVSKVASTTSASLLSTPIRRKARAKVSVFVSALGFSAPLGKVTVRKGTKTLASGKLTTSKYGRVTVTLPRLPKGRHKLKVKYAGNEQLLGSTSKAMTLTVTR